MLFSEPTWMMPINGYRFTKSSEFLCRRVTGNLGGRGWNIKFHWPRNYMIQKMSLYKLKMGGQEGHIQLEPLPAP